MSAPEYPVKTVTDFLAVPADKIDACLADFAMWVRMCHMKAEIDAGIEGLLGVALPLRTDSFLWVDDGQTGVSSIGFTDESGEQIAEMRIRKDEA